MHVKYLVQFCMMHSIIIRLVLHVRNPKVYKFIKPPLHYVYADFGASGEKVEIAESTEFAANPTKGSGATQLLKVYAHACMSHTQSLL